MSAVPQARWRTLDLFSSAIFVLMIFAPVLTAIVHWNGPPQSFAENRKQAELPQLPRTGAEFTRFPKALESWHDDHFGLRSTIMRAHNAFKLFVLNTSPSSRIVVGREQWLYLATERGIEVWRGADPLSFEELEAWRRCLESRKRVLGERGIQYAFALAPNKAEIYPEYLPERFHKVGPSRAAQLGLHLATRSSFRMIDLRDVLLEEKSRDKGDDYTYFPLGIHWNTRGAAAGLRGLVPELAKLLPAIGTVDDSITGQSPVDDQGDSWAARLYLSDVLRQQVRSVHFADEGSRVLSIVPEPGKRQITVDQADASLPRALIFHDSFGETLVPMLGRHFSHALFVWKPELDMALIEAEKPDIVLHLFNDRALVTMTPQEFDVSSSARIAAEYQEATRIALRVDCARNVPALQPQSGAEVSLRVDGSTTSIACKMQNDAATLRLPDFDAPEGSRAIVRIEMESPIASTASVFFQTRSQASFHRTRQYHYEIHQGLNEIFVELVDPDFNGKLLLKPSREAATFLIKSLEARLVDR